MAIIFDKISGTAAENLTAVEITRQKLKTGLSRVEQAIILLGTVVASSTIKKNELRQVFSSDEVGQLTGMGSELHLMSTGVFKNTAGIPAYILPATEGGAASVHQISVTGTATAAGELLIRIAGKVVPLSISNGDSNSVIATAIKDAVDKNNSLPVTAAASGGNATLTAKWKGNTSDAITVTVNAFSSDPTIPAGVTLAITKPTAGSGTVDISPALNSISEDQDMTILVHSYTDSTNLGKIEALENSRWNPEVVKGFIAVGCVSGTHTEATTITDARNSFVSCLVGRQGVPEHTAEVAGALGGSIAQSASADPALQMHTIKLSGLTLPNSGMWGWAERNSALKKGCSTIKGIGNDVVISQLRNTFTTSDTGAAAPEADRYITSVMTLAAIANDRKNYFLNTWGRAKLGEDTDVPPDGQKFMTPEIMKSELLNLYSDRYIPLGWCEALDDYAETITVERNSGNRNRLDVSDEVILVGNLRVTAMKLGFNFS